MEQKAKFILVGLLGVLMVFVFLYVQSYNSSKTLAGQLEGAQKENSSLNSKLSKIDGELKTQRSKAEALEKQTIQLSREKQELEKKYDLASKTNNELTEKLKSMRVQESQQQQQVAVATGGTPTEDAYWAGVIKSKADAELQLASLVSDLKALKITNEQLQRERSGVELELANLKRERDDLKRQFDYNQRLMDSIAQELVRERNDKMQIQESWNLVKNENKALIRQVNGLNNRKIELEKKVQVLMDEKAVSEKKYGQMQGLISSKISQVSELKEDLADISAGTEPGLDDMMMTSQRPDTVAIPVSGLNSPVDLQPIVVHAEPAIPAVPVRPGPLSSSKSVNIPSGLATILAVNKENNFVVIGAGEDQGVKSGDKFQVARDGKVMATVEAIQVRKNIAACDIKEQVGQLMIGDCISQ